jgi:hypothetical protein
MIGRRLVTAFFGVTLALGGVAATAVSASADTDPPTETPAPPANCDPVAFTVTVPGVGTVSFMADPCTGAISEVVVTPGVDLPPGSEIGDPVVTSEGVKILITAADGTIQVLEIEAEINDSGIKIETEIETDDDLGDSGDDHGSDSGDHGTSPNAGPGNSGESNSGTDAGSGTSGGGGTGDGGSGDGGSGDGDGGSGDGGSGDGGSGDGGHGSGD